jgi:hypothetical protein
MNARRARATLDTSAPPSAPAGSFTIKTCDPTVGILQTPCPEHFYCQPITLVTYNHDNESDGGLSVVAMESNPDTQAMGHCVPMNNHLDSHDSIHPTSRKKLLQFKSNASRDHHNRNLQQGQEPQSCDASLDIGTLQCDPGYYCSQTAMTDDEEETIPVTILQQDTTATGQCVPIKSKHEHNKTMLQYNQQAEGEHDRNNTQKTVQEDAADLYELNMYVCPDDADSTAGNCPEVIDGTTSFELVCYANGCNADGPTGGEDYTAGSKIFCKQDQSCTDFAVPEFSQTFCETAGSCSGAEVGFRTSFRCQAADACQGIFGTSGCLVFCEVANACPDASVEDSYLFCDAADACQNLAVGNSYIECNSPNACQGLTITKANNRWLCDGSGSCNGVTARGDYVRCAGAYACVLTIDEGLNTWYCQGEKACSGLTAAQDNFFCDPGGCDGATAVDSVINCRGPNDCDGLADVCYHPDSTSTCNKEIPANQKICRLCVFNDSCPADRTTPGMVGECDDTQIEAMCMFLREKTTYDAASLIFEKDGETCFKPCVENMPSTPCPTPEPSSAPSVSVEPTMMPTCSAKSAKATSGSKSTKSPIDPLCAGKGGKKGNGSMPIVLEADDADFTLAGKKTGTFGKKNGSV